MSRSGYVFPHNLDKVLSEVSGLIDAHFESRPGQFRSDVTLWGVVVSAIVGFLTAIAANQLPQGYFSKTPLSREEAYEVVEKLQSFQFQADLEKDKEFIVTNIVETLPPEVKDRQAVAMQIYSIVLTHLTKE
jgi:hypothetical protein